INYKVGSVKREVGVVGSRGKCAERSTEFSSSLGSSSSKSHMRQVQQDGVNSNGSLRPSSSNSRSGQTAVSDSPKSSLPVSRSFSSNQHINQGQQKEAVSLTGRSEDLENQASQLQDKASSLNISDDVIIAAHTCVSDTEHSWLTFGCLDADLIHQMIWAENTLYHRGLLPPTSD
ncbi:hypothetical protein HAX54_049072, partial [Datura stramonium]|nr:hypothetical protein [Datura stramonium]